MFVGPPITLPSPLYHTHFLAGGMGRFLPFTVSASLAASLFIKLENHSAMARILEKFPHLD